tara:strand:- start:74 stop:4816 length:4743 start_codon:yes stop_codon:yes gene_type:complete
MATTLFPDTKIDEDVVTRGPQGPVDTTIEAVVGTDTYKQDQADQGARFGKEPGQIIVNPLKTENVFNYGEYYDKFFFEENKGIGTMVAGNGEIIDFDANLSYEDKIDMFNQYQPRMLVSKSETELNEDGKKRITGTFGVDERIDTILRSNIDEKITSEAKTITPNILPNPFTDAPAPFSFSEYYKKNEKGEYLPDYSESSGRKAKEFLKFMDNSFPNMNAKTKASLINRNIYGISDMKILDPSAETGTGSGKVLGEKIITVVEDAPRALVDLAMSIVGVAGELSYDGLKNGINLIGSQLGEKEALLKDTYQFIYGGVPNPFSEAGRDLIRTYLGPDAAQSYRLSLAKDGILVSETQAYEILNYTADAADKTLLLTPMLVGEAMLISKIGDKGRKTFADEMKKFEAENSGLKGPELITAFLDQRKSNLPIYKNIKSFLDKYKLKESADIAEAAKPLAERSLYIEAKERVKVTRGDLADALTARKKEWLAVKASPNFVMSKGAKERFFNTPEINRLKALKVESDMMVRISEQISGTPKYVRDMYRDNTVFASIAAVTGQQLQQFGVPPEVGYIVGMGTMMAASMNKNSSTIRNLTDSQSYNPVNILTMMRKSKLFDEDMTSQEALQLLTNPKLDALDENGRRLFTNKEKKLAIELAERVNSLNPQVRDQIVANVMYYKDMRAKLVGTGDFSDDVLEATFGDMSGMAFYDALEDSFTYSMQQSKVFDSEITNTLTQLQNKRTQLMKNLEGHVRTILGTENLDKNNPAIIQFVDRIQETLSNSKIREDGMRAIKDSYIKSKTMLLQNMLHGSADPDVQKAIQSEYGDIVTMAESLVDDITLFSLDGNKVSIEQARDRLNLAEQSIQKEFLSQIANKKKRLRDKTGKIPSITDSTSGDAVVELAKYNDENASLARMAMINKKIAQAKARLPFQQFDEKYNNLYGTDASELGYKILNDIRLGSGDRASKTLVSQLMSGKDERNIFKVLNKGAGQTLDNMQAGSSSSFDFRASYTQKIRDLLPKELQSATITDLDIISYIQNVEGDLNVGIGLNMTDTQNLYSALSTKAYKAFRSNDTNSARTYGEYAREADGMFDKVVDMQGTPISDTAQNQIRTEVNAMRKGYRDNYTTPFLTQNTRTARWTNPVGGAANDTVETPGGKVWGMGNEPNTWFNLKTVAKLDDADVLNVNRDFRKMYGKYNSKTEMYEIDINSDGYKALQEVASIKFEREVARLQETISDPKQLQDAIDNLEQKTFDLFKSSEGGSDSAFRANHSYNSMTDIGARVNRDAKLKAKLDLEMIPFSKQLRKDGEIVYRAMRESGENIKMLQKVAETPTNKAFFERYIITANGPTELKALKASMTTGDNASMSVQQFDGLVKEMVSSHISALVIKPTGSVSIVPKADGKGFAAIKDTEFDTVGLNDLLSGDSPAMANLIRSGYLDDEHVENLSRINEFMNNRKKMAQRRGELKFTGEPRGLSIESYISRFYSISRGVVSPKYVMTEALVQNIRMAEHRMLKEMIMNPKVANILAELIVDGKKFTEQKELRLKEIFTTMAINAYASAAITREDEMKSGQKLPTYDFSKLTQ